MSDAVETVTPKPALGLGWAILFSLNHVFWFLSVLLRKPISQYGDPENYLNAYVLAEYALLALLFFVGSVRILHTVFRITGCYDDPEAIRS